MINTVFLEKEEFEYKNFKIIKPEYSLKQQIISSKHRMFCDLINMNMRVGCKNFYFSDGSVYLKESNQFYNMEHIVHKTDLILPKDIHINDWIVLLYEQQTTAKLVSYEKITPIKIYGNGRRIMGLDEPLICDMPFMSLRLTFLGDIEGWVVT
jgi:hypothetical protein